MTLHQIPGLLPSRHPVFVRNNLFSCSSAPAPLLIQAVNLLFLLQLSPILPSGGWDPFFSLTFVIWLAFLIAAELFWFLQLKAKVLSTC